MGGGNYIRDAPPHSFIDVNEFPNVKALADYLIYLDQNDVRSTGLVHALQIDLDESIDHMEPKEPILSII
jgi:hypothetical protein